MLTLKKISNKTVLGKSLFWGGGGGGRGISTELRGKHYEVSVEKE